MRPVFEIVKMVRDYVDLPTFLLTMCTYLLVYLYLQRSKNLPPGPWALPFLGNAHHYAFARFVPARFTELSKKYGDVMSLQVSVHMVVLSGYSTIREALVNKADCFSSRNHDQFITTLRGGEETPLGIFSAVYGPVWKRQRQFALKTLRNFGVGKRSMEAKICEEAEALNREIVAKDGRPFDIKTLLKNAVSNVICSVAFGRSFDYGDPDFLHLLEMLDGIAKARPGRDVLPKILPVLKKSPFFAPYLTFFAPQHGKMTYCVRQIQSFFEEQIAQHKATFHPNNVQDFIDAFLLEQKKAETDDNKSGFTDKQLREVLGDLFLAGSETTTDTLRWALVYMMVNPAVQEKVQGEIDAVLGQAVPSYALRDRMPYTTATLAEVQRINTVVPLTTRATSRDTTLNGYYIPSGTFIVVNLWSVFVDPELFPEPHIFNPDRFLDQDGNFVKHRALIPFSVGPRVCLGEQLAKMELFLFFVCMMQRFTFQLPEDAPAPSLVGQVGGASSAPPAFELCAVPRG